jgi:hypothetical protein
MLVANLLARRSDIRCAVVASAPLDLALYYRRQDGTMPDYFAMRRGELADPMRTVREIRSDAAVLVIGDTRDRSVPHAAWKAWEAVARRQGPARLRRRRRGHRPPGARRRGKPTTSPGCAPWKRRTPAPRARRASSCGGRWRPASRSSSRRGRRLGGGEIRAAFAGRRLAGATWLHWGTRATLLTSWGADGERHDFHPAHPERRIAAHRWWVEGDRLCTADNGCNAVLADGRFLHVVAASRRAS